MTHKQSLTWFLLVWLIVHAPVWLAHADEEATPLALGWQRLILENLPVEIAPRMSALSWKNECERLLQQALPHVRIGRPNQSQRYFGMAGLQQVEFALVEKTGGADTSALLARVSLRLLLYDVRTQQEIVRASCYGYGCVPGKLLDAETMQALFTKALTQGVEECASHIAVNLRVQGEVKRIAPNRETNTTVALIALGS